MQLESLSYQIRAAIFEVFKELGSGLLESVYEAALVKEFELVGIAAKSQIALPVNYNGRFLELGFRIDILVNEKNYY